MTKNTQTVLIVGGLAAVALWLFWPKKAAAEPIKAPAPQPAKPAQSAVPVEPKKKAPAEPNPSSPTFPELHYDGQREMSFKEDLFRGGLSEDQVT